MERLDILGSTESLSAWTVCTVLLAATLCVDGRVETLAAQPAVTFDVSYLVACRDVATSESDNSHPNEKLIEAKFAISSLLRGNEADIVELLYRIESPRLGMRVVDYLPRTQLETDLAGNVNVETSHEATRSLGLGVSGKYQQYLNGDASATRGKKDASKLRYELLPPLEIVASSGTTRRGTGAYFKLRPSPRTTLEGSKDFVTVLRVPQSWRAGSVDVSCESLVRVDTRGLGTSAETGNGGRGRFVVALYLEGDDDALRAAENFVLSERHLRAIARRNHREVTRRSYPSLAHRIGRVFSVVDPKIPDNWLDLILANPAAGDGRSFAHRLPADIHAAAANYQLAKARLAQLKG